MEQHIRLLGILNIVWGGMSALAGLLILVVSGGAYGIVEALSRQESATAMALPLIAILGCAISTLVLLLSVPSIIAGIGLLHHRSWARVLTIIMSALHLFNFPLGTALGVYGFWVLFSQKSQNVFAAH